MNYDVVIVGSGVAGLTAAIYTARAGKSVVVLENSIIGGTTATLESIENWEDSNNIVGCITVFCGDVRLIDNIKYKG